MMRLRVTVGCCKRRSCVPDRQPAIYGDGGTCNITRGREDERQGDMRHFLWLAIASEGRAALGEDGLLIFGKARRDCRIDWALIIMGTLTFVAGEQAACPVKQHDFQCGAVAEQLPCCARCILGDIVWQGNACRF